MPVIEQFGIRLEYPIGDEAPVPSGGKIKLHVRVSPPHVNNQVWFAFQVEDGQWLRKKASREFRSAD